MTNTPSTAIMWFRNDLRLSDNSALLAACEHKNIIPVYIFDNNAGRALGAAKKWWLFHALQNLQKSLADKNTKLILRSGPTDNALNELIEETGATAIYWNRRYEPDTIALDSKIKSDLTANGLAVKSFAGHLLHEPTQTRTKSGTPFKVFTPFWKSLQASIESFPPNPAPEIIPGLPKEIASQTLESWNLTPTKHDWAADFVNHWEPGEDGAAKVLSRFLKAPVSSYQEKRDFPAIEGTSKLSSFMAFGEISPRQIWHASEGIEGAAGFRRQVAWRDFSYHLLIHNKDLSVQNFNQKFNIFPWNEDQNSLELWQKGMTGYPIVDAGMRQLWQTGYMHNRVRMIVASFLTKHLMIDWRRGEEWFWDTLLDADIANNAAGWQWVAGSGADASPYYRIFNPIIQGKKFDPDGTYVKSYLPELDDLDPKYIHTPWEAPAPILQQASVILDQTYPAPIVDHSFARARALKAYESLKEAA